MLALSAIWPAVDDYAANSELLAQALAERQLIEAEVAQLPELQARLAERQTELAQWEGRTVSETSLHLFRGRIVELARTHSCQVRQIRVGNSRQRPWRPGDDPLDPNPPAGADGKGSFALKTQELSMSVSGTLPNIKAFIGGLTSLGYLAHHRSLSMNAGGGNEKEVSLELGLLLFDLQRTEAAANASTPAASPGGDGSRAARSAA